MNTFKPLPVSDDLHEWATHYAMTAQDEYEPRPIGLMDFDMADRIESELERIRQAMNIKFGEYATQQAIRSAHDILRMMGFHKE